MYPMDWVRSLKRAAPLGAAALTFLAAGDAAAERVVFINLNAVTLNSDGGQDPTVDSYTSNGFTPGAVSGMALTAEELALLHFYLKEATTPFDIQYVFDRPAAGSYDMVVFGSEADANGRFAENDCSPAIGLADCGDGNAQNISFVFQGCLPAAQQTDMRRIAYYSLTGLGFGWGLENESAVGQIMGSYSVFGLQFGSECVSIVDGTCPAHPDCAAGEQNATADLNIIVNARVDDGPPVVTITEPADGASVDPVFGITADVLDGFGGLQVSLSADIDGTPISEEITEPPYEWDFNGVPSGTWTFEVSATDADGGMVTASVTVTVDEASTSGGSTTGGADTTGGDPTVDPTDPTANPSTSGDPTADPTDGTETAGTEGGEDGSSGPIDPTAPVNPAAFGVGGTGCECRSAPDGGGWEGLASLGLIVLGATASRRRGRTSTRPSQTSSRLGRTSR